MLLLIVLCYVVLFFPWIWCRRQNKISYNFMRLSLLLWTTTRGSNSVCTQEKIRKQQQSYLKYTGTRSNQRNTIHTCTCMYLRIWTDPSAESKHKVTPFITRSHRTTDSHTVQLCAYAYDFWSTNILMGTNQKHIQIVHKNVLGSTVKTNIRLSKHLSYSCYWCCNKCTCTV